MPFLAAAATTFRQDRWESLIALRKKLSSIRLVRFCLLSKASLIFPRKRAANDATAAPHEGDAAVVEVPLVLLGRRAHEHVALGVRDDFGSVEAFADVFDELSLGRRG